VLDTSTIELVVGTLSAAGFSVNLAVPGLSVSAGQYVAATVLDPRVTQQDAQAIRLTFGYRLTERLASSWWLGTFLVVACVFMLAGILDLTYLFTTSPGLAWAGAFTIVGLLMTAGCWAAIVAASSLVPVGQVNSIVKSSAPPTKPKNSGRRSTKPPKTHPPAA
jgi:hypothetical protein